MARKTGSTFTNKIADRTDKIADKIDDRDSEKKMEKETTRLDEQAVQINDSSPDDLKKEIEKTRVHMDENLALLGRKLSPKRLRALQTPLALLFLGVAGIFIFRRFRQGWHVKSHRSGASVQTKYVIKKMRFGNLGRVGQLRTVLQLVGASRRGKPVVLIVQPMKG